MLHATLVANAEASFRENGTGICGPPWLCAMDAATSAFTFPVIPQWQGAIGVQFHGALAELEDARNVHQAQADPSGETPSIAVHSESPCRWPTRVQAAR